MKHLKLKYGHFCTYHFITLPVSIQHSFIGANLRPEAHVSSDWLISSALAHLQMWRSHPLEQVLELGLLSTHKLGCTSGPHQCSSY